MELKSVAPLSRTDQRNAVIAGFLGWTLDAFDFFIRLLSLGYFGLKAGAWSFYLILKRRQLELARAG